TGEPPLRRDCSSAKASFEHLVAGGFRDTKKNGAAPYGVAPFFVISVRGVHSNTALSGFILPLLP
ncbi:MAG: hypothetical protein ACI3YE_08355, partial [Candidatus Avispirillum sp.]